MLDKLSALEQRFSEIERLMADPQVVTDAARLVALGKERAALEPLVSTYRTYRDVVRQLQEVQALLEESSDADMVVLAREELDSLADREIRLQEELRIALLPKDPREGRDVFIEIRAAAGGEESGLFAAELYRMYARYAQLRGWAVEVVDAHETGIGGFKEMIFEVKGAGAYSRLKYESGAHRVQRVPATESSGRIHTSTVTVAVMPEADEVDVHVDEKDLRIDIYHAGGHGGQNVQKVATAVRIVHVPTGIVATCQDERSQLRNKQKAMAVLRARLLDKATQDRQDAITEERRSKVGTGERSEKVRTYNFPQDRVTDHRINLTLHNLPAVLEGSLDAIIDALLNEERARLLHKATAA
ncbi:MAG: peptide chain release factor 1 [Chloroflexi bacterium]|nr:peptide chain release factor 1 [Chloroflexota bacterium]